MIIEVLATMLIGSVSNLEGRIGILVSTRGRIYNVHKVSPSATMGLKTGDVVLSCDGIKGTKYIKGPVGSLAHLVIKRDDEEFKVDIVRVPEDAIDD